MRYVFHTVPRVMGVCCDCVISWPYLLGLVRITLCMEIMFLSLNDHTNLFHCINICWPLCWARTAPSGFQLDVRGVSRISGKRVHMHKGVGFALLILSLFLNIPWKWNNLVSLRPNYFIFIGYLKTGAGSGVHATPWAPLDPPLMYDKTSAVTIFIEKSTCG